jgi:hypothetical protein
MMSPEKFGKILTKLPKEKIELSKVELSKMQDLEDAISTASMMEGAFQDAYDDAQVLVIKASDIIRFDWSDAITEAEGALQELEIAFKELGVDEPSEVTQYRKQLEESENERIIADKKLDGIGK